MSQVFFDELGIRKSNFNLEIGGKCQKHYNQLSKLSEFLPNLIKAQNLQPDLILFLGDSNSVLIAPVLKKEGYKIGHIEAGMRSGDTRMLEEINRIVCDHVSDYHFVYHQNYKGNLIREGISSNKIFVVGNTIVEPVLKFIYDIQSEKSKKSHILLDIHRPENYNDEYRMGVIVRYCQALSKQFHVPVKMLEYEQYYRKYQELLGSEFINLTKTCSYKEYLKAQYDSVVLVSDSGTAQEEACLLGVRTVVPRDFTERPESVDNNCSYMIRINNPYTTMQSLLYITNNESYNTEWLGDGNTSENIVNILKQL
jgi:UDP-N-acetylglucosamine 2-epimerase (non-hydrolysing)